jgi:S1-C subfamily serine protease
MTARTPRLLPPAAFLAALLWSAAPAPAAEPRAEAGLAAAEAHDRRVYEAVSPAVVGITCRTSPAEGYFGTGVVISPDGLILTSTTVVPKGAGSIQVFFRGALQKEAKVVGTDQATEAALIRVEAGQKLAYVPLADSATARPGELAYTFGNPFMTLAVDDKVSFSKGAVSGVYRLTGNGDFESKYRDLAIETEAAVNPGSDGGPLIDGQGRLLGIISLGYSERRWLGCAVPVHVIQPKIEAMKDLRPAAGHVAPPEAVRRREAAWREAVERLAPAVVQVIVPREEKFVPRPENVRMDRRAMESARRYKMRPEGPASGVLVSAEGHVLTAQYHLTGKVRADGLKVRLADGRELPAKALGFDASLDLAMLKVEPGAEKLPFAELAADAEPEVGEALAVVGRSEDLKTVTVNRGLVSAAGRGFRGTLQISAFVNYGNSGGAAVDAAGRLVGVTGHLRPDSHWGQNSGVGFVNSSRAIRAIYAELAAGKEVQPPPRTFLGVGPGPDSATVLGAPVGQVLAGSAAEEAGLKPGDLVTHMDGQPVESWPALVRSITGHKPGDTVRLTVARAGQNLEVQVKLRAGR